MIISSSDACRQFWKHLKSPMLLVVCETPVHCSGHNAQASKSDPSLIIKLLRVKVTRQSLWQNFEDIHLNKLCSMSSILFGSSSRLKLRVMTQRPTPYSQTSSLRQMRYFCAFFYDEEMREYETWAKTCSVEWTEKASSARIRNLEHDSIEPEFRLTSPHSSAGHAQPRL